MQTDARECCPLRSSYLAFTALGRVFGGCRHLIHSIGNHRRRRRAFGQLFAFRSFYLFAQLTNLIRLLVLWSDISILQLKTRI